MDTLSTYLLKLKEQNFKITVERKSLLGIFLKFPGRYFTVYELYSRLKSDGFRAGYATIYRNLKLFQQMDFIQVTAMENGIKKYEWKC
ncbi:Fur family transcriptional regulator [Anaerocolumna jejuensis]|uniref:Fur family transcriptional regulator n=1 Tax=Anaerocolumna jejuensis TaxID=259063 RepID=UPI003F7C9621